MSGKPSPGNWLRELRRGMTNLPGLRSRVPDAPTLPVRDLWPGDPGLGARLLKGELTVGNSVRTLVPGGWGDTSGSPLLRAAGHTFTWLRDLRALGTDAARQRARTLVLEWIALPHPDSLALRPDVMGARIAAWLGHYDFFAASADDAFRQKLMGRLVSDARALSAALPAEEGQARALTAIKGLIAAAVALPDQNGFLARGLRFLPAEIGRQVLPDGSHIERSPAHHLAALQDLTEVRSLLQAAQAPPPATLAPSIEKLATALRMLRHGDGGLALFNGTKEETSSLVDLVLTQAGRPTRAPSQLVDGGFQRLQAGRSVLIMDTGAPPPPGLDAQAHAGTLSFEMSVGRERMIVNCGASPAAMSEWRDALRGTAAHSTLVLADTNSAEIRAEGLGARRPETVDVQRQEANGAHWLEASHDGWLRSHGALHRRRLYMAESGEDIRGEDAVEAASPLPFAIRFHLHPAVQAMIQGEGDAVLLRLPSGQNWRLRAEGASLALEESIYMGGSEPRRTAQIVLTGDETTPQQVKWALTKVG